MNFFFDYIVRVNAKCSDIKNKILQVDTHIPTCTYCMKHPIEGEMDGGISCRGSGGGNGGRGGSLLQGDEPPNIEKNTLDKSIYK